MLLYYRKVWREDDVEDVDVDFLLLLYYKREHGGMLKLLILLLML